MDELKRLDGQIDSVQDLNSLKPIFYRLEEVTRDYPDDFDVQMRVSDIKQHLMNRGMQLKQQGAIATASNPVMQTPGPGPIGGPPPAGMPPMPSGMPPMSSGMQPAAMPATPSGMPVPPAVGMSAAPGMPPPPLGGPPSPMGASSPIDMPPAPPMANDQFGATSMHRPPAAADPFGSTAMQQTAAPQPQGYPEPPRDVFVPPVRQVPPPVGPGSPEVPPPQPQGSAKKAVLMGGGIGLLLALIGGGAWWYLKRHPQPPPPPPVAAVPIEVASVPPGAEVRVNDQVKCKANCRVELAPGQYNLSAVLPGYDPALQTVVVEKGKPLSLTLTMTAQVPSLKIFTDLGNGGQVMLDGKPAGALQDGQIVLDRVPEGKHEVRVTGDKGEAKFGFNVTAGAAPTIEGPISTRNLTAVVASSLGNQIHVGMSGTTPMKVSLDGKEMGEAGPGGMDLKDVASGDHELTLNDGKDDRKITVTATPSPVLTAWVNSSVTGGILVVNVGEDNATVLIDGKAYPRKTRRGQLWVPNLPPKDYTIKVSKPGFQDVPEQKTTIKKGAETRLAFKMQAIPQIAVLKISGGIAGAEVFVDKQSIGRIETDGTLSYSNVSPGDHTIEIRRDQYAPKTITKNFGPGATVELSGDSVAMERAMGSLKLMVTPPNAQVTIRRTDETRANPIAAGSHPLPVGSYTLVAKAAGYTDATMNVQIRGGDFALADLKLVKEGGGTIPKPPTTKADWDRPGDWQPDNGWLVHRGGNFVGFSAQPSTGLFTFSCQLLKGGVFNKHIQWRVGYVDDKNYVHYQIDKKSLQSKIVTNGKSVDRPKLTFDEQEPFTMQIEITPDTVVTRMRQSDQWVVVDRLSKPGVNQGKFGFFVPGKDEIAISGFSFTPR